MSTFNTTYYSLTKVREQGPEAKDWAVTDQNFESIALLLKAFEQHAHTGTAAIDHPGFYDPPAAPTVTPQGTSGTTTYTYYIVARGAIHKESATGTTATGNATLTGSNFNRVTWSAVAGATGYDVIRLTGAATQGSIALNLSAGTTQFDDTGIAASDYIPVRQPALSEVATGGILPSGGVIGVRLAYVNALGLETDACREVTYQLSAAAERPLTPTLSSVTPGTPGLSGGTYLYVMTKVKDGGETTASDILAVEVKFDSIYQVLIGFDPINTYLDDTDALNLYRSSGFGSPFQLVTTITTTSQSTFTDTNTIAAQNVNTQPPSVNTFGASRKLRIDWSELEPHPSEAQRLRVYVTNQTGIWSPNSLLVEFDITGGSPPDFIDYLGSETLGAGWPKEASQIPSAPPKLNLGTEATGGFDLTANGDFNGFQALDMRLENRSGGPGSPQNGWIYYDTSIPTVRAYINGAWVNWGTTAATAYTHPSEEAGGHIAANLKFVSGGATVKSVLDYIANTSTGARKQVTLITRPTISTTPVSTTSTTAVQLPDCVTAGISGEFSNQWVHITLSGHFTINSAGATLSIGIEYDGSMSDSTIRSFTASSNNQNVSLFTEYWVQVPTSSKIYKALWWTSGGTINSVGLRRNFTVHHLW